MTHQFFFFFLTAQHATMFFDFVPVKPRLRVVSHAAKESRACDYRKSTYMNDCLKINPGNVLTATYTAASYFIDNHCMAV